MKKPATVCIKMVREETVDDLIDKIDDEAIKAKMRRILPASELGRIRYTTTMDCAETIPKPPIVARTR